ncbi:hypothetical protein AXK11_07240 [Cephaloticoccus primus]|uniref:Uncharacterized protein n=1 Tax=Cephaloticoccus primus TaxID=1548207 RepID=A0A139SKS6_9BACT|nr:hypothetical protein [Cephaloticoccus primus]KXU35139.1 hypothetical protein AXK11_07240 [Cephaloticoccus primus]
MDDTQDKQAKPADLNTLDLSQLQGFSFGTKWESKPAEKREGGPRGEHAGRRDFGAGGARRDWRAGGGGGEGGRGDRPGGGPASRDRRGFRKPGPADAPASAAAGTGDSRREGAAPQDQRQGGWRAQDGVSRRAATDGRAQDGASRDGRAQGSFSPRGGADRRAQGSGGGAGPRGGGGRFANYNRERPHYEPPYDSPHFAVSFYPEDKSFASLAKTIRSSYRTLELFEIARTVVAKNDRFIVHLTRKPAAPPADAAPRQPIYIARPDGVPFDSEDAVINYVVAQHIGQFFHTEQVQIDPPKGNFQVINRCGVTGELLGPPNYHRYNQIVQQHFDTRIKHLSFDAFRAKIETLRDPEAIAQWLEKMKTITRYTWCSADTKKTGETKAQAAASTAPTESVTGNEPTSAAQASAATDADAQAAAAQETPAAQTEGLPVPPSETVHAENPESAKASEAAPAASETGETAPAEASATGQASEPSASGETPASETASSESPESPAAPAANAAAPEETPAVTFDSLEEARLYLLTHARGQVYRTSDTARFHGNLLDKLPEGEIRRAIEGALERQRRFPLDTANGLRGRLRREHFTIFKKGTKGIAYVCAVKRKFRTPGQTFADSIAALIDFIEKNPMVLVSELPERFLGLKPAPAPAAEPASAAADKAPLSPAGAGAQNESPSESAPASEAVAAVAAPAPEKSAEAVAENSAVASADTVAEREALHRLQLDLRWLVTEGYVTEFIDGRLFAAPPMPESRKRAAETGEEHDPENFPDAPKPTPAPQKSDAPKMEPAPAAPANAEPPPTELSEVAKPEDAATQPTTEPPAPPAAEGPFEPAAAKPEPAPADTAVTPAALP